VKTRLAVAVPVACVALLVSRVAVAGPEQWFSEGMKECSDKYMNAAKGTSFTCNICGVGAGCTGSDCHWGGIKANATSDKELGTALAKGYQLYCLNQGGALLPSASPAAVQSRAASATFRAVERERPSSPRGMQPLSMGGLFDFTTKSVYGVALPLSTSYSGAPGSAWDLGGALLFGKGADVTQFGAAFRPGYRLSAVREAGEAGARGFFGLGVPIMLVVNSGTGLETALGYQAGGGILTGVVSDHVGYHLGAALAGDFLYAQGVQVPVQGILRASFDVGTFTRLAIQPGAGVNVAAAGKAADTLQINALTGLELGSWLLGAQAFIQSDGFGMGLGVSHIGQLAEALREQERVVAPAAPGERKAAEKKEGAAPGAAAGGDEFADWMGGKPEAPGKPPERDVVVLKSGTRVSGTIRNVEPGVRVEVLTEEGKEVAIEWALVERLERAGTVPAKPAQPRHAAPPQRVAAPAPRPEPPQAPPVKPAWDLRGGVQPHIVVHGQGAGFVLPQQTFKMPPTCQNAQGNYTHFRGGGGGGGFGTRLGLTVLDAPDPASGSSWTAFRVGSGVDVDFVAMGHASRFDEDECRIRTVSAHGTLLMVPSTIGVVFGLGGFGEPHRWRGAAIGLSYAPSYVYLKPSNGQGAGKFNYAGAEITLDVGSMSATADSHGSEARFRITGNLYPALGDDWPFVSTLGFGAVWY
jgi:hypothetical protein